MCGECCGDEVPELAAAAWPLVDEYVLSEATRSLLKLLADTDALLAALPPPPPQVHGARVGLGLPTSPVKFATRTRCEPRCHCCRRCRCAARLQAWGGLHFEVSTSRRAASCAACAAAAAVAWHGCKPRMACV